MKIDKEQVQLLMAKQGMKQYELSELAGVSRQTLSAVMNGRSCRPEALGRIAKALKVDPEEILQNKKE